MPGTAAPVLAATRSADVPTHQLPRSQCTQCATARAFTATAARVTEHAWTRLPQANGTAGPLATGPASDPSCWRYKVYTGDPPLPGHDFLPRLTTRHSNCRM